MRWGCLAPRGKRNRGSQQRHLKVSVFGKEGVEAMCCRWGSPGRAVETGATGDRKWPGAYGKLAHTPWLAGLDKRLFFRSSKLTSSTWISGSAAAYGYSWDRTARDHPGRVWGVKKKKRKEKQLAENKARGSERGGRRKRRPLGNRRLCGERGEGGEPGA